MPESPEQLKESLAGRYAVEREIGRGGMATVYLAEDLKHHRKVAIKVLSPEISAAIGGDRFLREIEIAAQLSHPHILPMFDSGAADSLFYYVTPFIEGDSLRAHLVQRTQLSVEDSLRTAREIASALSYAHGHGVIHRDIKPENILLSGGAAVLADFGIARAVSAAGPDGLTKTGVTLGTPLYMSPEQAHGDAELDGRTDIYSLGCVLYEMLAGEPPFTGPDARAILARHALDPVPPIATRRPDMDASVERVVTKSLSKTPADRYESAVRFAEALHLAEIGAATPQPAKTEADIANNLPHERNSFIGRKRELAECARQLGESRLLTLTGVGGCGKTRLATQLANRLLENFSDGVWFVALASISEGHLVTQALATVLGVTEKPGQTLLQTVTEEIADTKCLILLDNCEHLLVDCIELVDALLDSAPRLKFLATSREGLGVEGERLIAVGALSYPRKDSKSEIKEIEGSESVQLFLARATSVSAGFTLTQENAPTIADICERLDGVPLAIELAAARVRVLSVDQIFERLGDRFRLLTGGRKTALPRHQTLLAAIQWSYDLLTDEERHQLYSLSVFFGGWSLEAANAVLGPDPDEFEVLELMTRLLDKSLIIVERSGDGDTRYRQLETMRQYGQDRLKETGEADEVRRRHLDYFADYVREFRKRLEQRHTGNLAEYSVDNDNYRAALEWGLSEEPLTAAKLCASLGLYWDRTGQYEEGRNWIYRFLNTVRDMPNLLRAYLLADSGMLARRQDAQEKIEEELLESLAIARQEGEDILIARTLRLLGSAATAKSDYDLASRYESEALQIYRRLGHRSGELSILNNMSVRHLDNGENAKAQKLMEELVVLRRQDNIPFAATIALANLAIAHVNQNHTKEARKHLDESVTLGRQFESDRGAAHCLAVATKVLVQEGHLQESARVLGWINAVLDSQAIVLETLEQSLCDESHQFLSENMSESELRQELAKGAMLNQMEAADLYLGVAS